MDFLVNPPEASWNELLTDGRRSILVADDDADRAAVAAEILAAPSGALLIVTDAMIGLEIAGEIHAALSSPSSLQAIGIITLSDPDARQRFLALARTT